LEPESLERGLKIHIIHTAEVEESHHPGDRLFRVGDERGLVAERT
jgi:hypothetical protein